MARWTTYERNSRANEYIAKPYHLNSISILTARVEDRVVEVASTASTISWSGATCDPRESTPAKFSIGTR